MHVIRFQFLLLYYINPRRACAARVTVVVPCVCLSVATYSLVFFSPASRSIINYSLVDKITTILQGYGLDLTKLRGQAYDGAGNMAGSVRGTATLITTQYPLALYLHCASHSLNLVVVKSLEVTSVRNMMGVVDRVSVFLAAHPKRQRALQKSIAETQPESTVSKLKDLCRTK